MRAPNGRVQPTPPAPPTPPAVGASAAREAAREAARVASELARARSAVSAAERSAGVRPSLVDQAPGGGGAVIIGQEQPNGRTIQTPGGTTVISTDPKTGVVTIKENGHITQVIDPRQIANDAARAATSAIASTPPPFPPLPDGGPPESVIRLTVNVLLILAIMLIGFPIVRAIGRRMERKPATTDPELTRRLDRIEQAIETMAVEVERVSEAHRYSARLLTERLPESPALRVAPTSERAS